MTLVLITGASGFIGSQTVDVFLRHGYRVRLAGRNASACHRMLAVHSKFKTQIETVIVADITAPGAFDDAVRGVNGVIHMASPFTYNVQDNEKDLIIPAVSGTTEILKSTAAYAPEVRRIVLTSSFAAINDFSKGLRPGHTYDETQWNPITRQQVKDSPPGLAYAGSKTIAERAAWDFVNTQQKVNFSLSTINPVMVYGPPLEGSLSIKHLGQSTSEIYALMNGSLESVPQTPMPVFVDVRDVAEAHRLAFETESPGRFAVCGGSFTHQAVCRLLVEKRPSLASRVPKQGLNDESLRPQHYEVDTGRARTVLGMGFRSLDETFLDMADALLELEGSYQNDS